MHIEHLLENPNSLSSWHSRSWTPQNDNGSSSISYFSFSWVSLLLHFASDGSQSHCMQEAREKYLASVVNINIDDMTHFLLVGIK